MKFIVFTTFVVFSVYILHCTTAPVTETSMQDEGDDVVLQLDEVELISLTEDSQMLNSRTKRSARECKFCCNDGFCGICCSF